MFGLNQHDGLAVIDSTGHGVTFPELVEAGCSAVSSLGSSKALLFLYCGNNLTTAAFYAGSLLEGHAVAMLDGAAMGQVKARAVLRYRPAWIAGPVGIAEELSGHGVEIASTREVAGGELTRTTYPAIEGIHPDLSLLLPTSGTTGSTKLVRLSRKNVESNANAISEYLSLQPDERPITSLPLHYAFGLSVLNSHWAAGAPTVLCSNSFLQEDFWNVFSDQECTSLAGVPFSYQVLERIGFRKKTFPALRSMQQAGGALDRRLQQLYADHMAECGGKFFVMYGQTEATARMSYVPPERLREKIGSAGIAIPNGSITIESPEEVTVESPSTGEVIYEGPNVMMGYAESREDLLDGNVCNGMLKTGDLGYLDDEGFLFLVGRSKRIAKIAGLRINLDELEVRVRENGPAAAIAHGETIFVFCSFGNDESLNQMRLTLAREFKINHNFLSFRKTEEVPSTSSGKIDYKKLQQWLTT